ncbi:MAG: hypothetical protein HY343_09180 [Lentisphaerae bacterium]|nr:hypothetical protein [Lentisphaerota bacterium]
MKWILYITLTQLCLPALAEAQAQALPYESGFYGRMEVATNILFVSYVGKTEESKEYWTVPVIIAMVNIGSTTDMTWGGVSLFAWRCMSNSSSHAMSNNPIKWINNPDGSIVLDIMKDDIKEELLDGNEVPLECIPHVYRCELVLSKNNGENKLERWQAFDYELCWTDIAISNNGVDNRLWLRKRVRGGELIQTNSSYTRLIGRRTFRYITSPGDFIRQE